MELLADRAHIPQSAHTTSLRDASVEGGGAYATRAWTLITQETNGVELA